MTFHEEGRAVTDFFQSCAICIFAENVTLDFVLDSSGFVSSIAVCISMKLNLEFLAQDFV